MQSSLVLTIIGPDRTGLVESVAAAVTGHGGNWVESRMARLAGQFAGILRVAVPRESRDELTRTLRRLESEGLRILVESSDEDTAAPAAAPLKFEILGHDRPGVVRDVAQLLARRGVNVVELDTEVYSAPMTGEPLFKATVEAAPPAEANLDDLRQAIEQAAEGLGMDVAFEA